MAKLKFKLNEPDYLEGSPEELANFVKLLKGQLSIEKPTELKNTKIEEIETLIEKDKPETKIVIPKEPIEQIPTNQNSSMVFFSLPKEEEVINYIISKEHFEHHTVELQERFLGGRVRVRDNPTFYGSFDNIIRNVRKHIANKYNGTWNNKETKSLGGKTHVTIYRFEKSEEKQEDVNSPPKYFSIAKSKDLDTINV